jgi:hypothetical protein
MLGYASSRPRRGAWRPLRAAAVLALAAVLWGAATLLTGLVPALAALTLLLLFRFLLGAAEAATYPGWQHGRLPTGFLPANEPSPAWSSWPVRPSEWSSTAPSPRPSWSPRAGERLSADQPDRADHRPALVEVRDRPSGEPSSHHRARELALIGADRPDRDRAPPRLALTARRSQSSASSRSATFSTAMSSSSSSSGSIIYLTDERGFGSSQGWLLQQSALFTPWS